MEKILKDFKTGEKEKIIRILEYGHIKRSLFDMGLTPCTDVIMRKTSPLKDPIELTVRNYELSIRKSEASTIILETKEEA